VAPVHLGITNLAARIALVVPVAMTVGEVAGVMRRGYFCRTGAPSARRRPRPERTSVTARLDEGKTWSYSYW
jgi:hypothetical protein